MRAEDASESLRAILDANRTAYATDSDGTRYRAQWESDVEIRIRRYVPAEEDEESGRAEEVDREPSGLEWQPGG